MVLSYILLLYRLHSIVLLFLCETIKFLNETCIVSLSLSLALFVCVCVFEDTKALFYIYPFWVFFILSCHFMVQAGVIVLHSEDFLLVVFIV